MTRSLRIGVVLADRLVEERLFDGATPVTFGQSLRSALSVPVEGVPREHVLFARPKDSGRFVLRLPPGMRGRVGTKQQLIDVGDGREMTLEKGARGKLTIGDATILFQEVATPPATPRPQLPAAIRGTFADRIDRRLALIIGSSLVVHIGLAAWAWTTDVDEKVMGLPSVAQTYHHDVIDVSFPDETPVKTDEPGAATPAKPVQTPAPIVRPTQPQHLNPTTKPPTNPGDAQRLASILTGNDGEVGKGGMSPRQPGADLGKQIADVRDQNLKIGDGTQTSRVDDRTNIGTRPDAPTFNPGELTRTERPDNEEPKGRIIPGVVDPDETTTLTPQMVRDRITTVYMQGLQRCYRLGLKDDSTLSGRVAITFTVDDRGKVIDPDAKGVSTEVDSCIQSFMGSWRFAVPKDDGGKPTDATFKVSLALQPS